MWQFELLGRVIPAFTALADSFIHPLATEDVRDDSKRCYVDFIQIGMVLSKSRGEWAPELELNIIEGLLGGLNERLPKKKGVFDGIFPWGDKTTSSNSRSSGGEQFVGLNDFSYTVSPNDIFSFDECAQLESLSSLTQKQYLEAFGPKVKLFRKEEINSKPRRRRFLKSVEDARTHLMNVYFKNTSDAGILSLPDHPSYGVKRFANALYIMLQNHWTCAHNLPKRSSTREARLSLTRHRNPVLRVPKGSDKSPSGAKFEVLLLACKDQADWKVTNFDIRNSLQSQGAPNSAIEAVQKDICNRLILCEEQKLKIEFLAVNNELWHANSGFLDQNPNQYSVMYSLDQLLGESRTSSRLSSCHIRDQILLCYNLANSMLDLYRGYWVHNPWSSKEVCFFRPSMNSGSSILSSPYIAVKLKSIGDQKETASPFLQVHKHPAILRLGIILLEIATGLKFEESNDQEQVSKLNKDNYKASDIFKDIQEQSRKDPTKRLPSGLSRAISACLDLKPTPSITAAQLTGKQEGPIRQYILSCIVAPLASDLSSFGVTLERSHDYSSHGMNKDRFHEVSAPTTDKQQAKSASCSSDKSTNLSNELERLENREGCLFASREDMSLEESVDQRKIISAEKWLGIHRATCAKIDELRKQKAGDSPRIKIALLDSGIDLSDFHKDEINQPVDVKYRSWVGDSSVREDDAGHGTHLAYLLREIAPNAEIHVGRIFKKRPSIKKSAGVIAEAIYHCVDVWEVDMIVMSFGFGEEDSGIYQSIKYAASKDVIMFAAACNDGKNRSDGFAWPAKDSNVICVHSSDGDGTPSTFTPSPQDGMRVMVLGECVDSAWPPKFKSNKNRKLMSGTSCAAPIAAEIAAVLLDFAKGILPDEDMRRLHRTASIQRLFRKISNPHGGYHWVRHWSLFDSGDQVNLDWIKGEIQGALNNR